MDCCVVEMTVPAGPASLTLFPDYPDSSALNSGRCISMLLDISKLPRMQETRVSDSLWALVGECFDTDDGSLPGIELTGLSRAGVVAMYAMLRRRSRLEGDPPEFWSRTEEASRPVDSVANAAELVDSGRSSHTG